MTSAEKTRRRHKRGTRMPQPMPAISLAAVPGRRKATLEIAGEMERRGFAGIYCPSGFGGMALCEALAFATKTIPFGTAIAPIYTQLGRASFRARECQYV